ncbi:PhoD-like phosphatase [Nocardia otitidiscaviarum]|uniref:PhoD-like phosphatase n=1 Tax=Nocardia otitidiscaviarum TaxID=1823 RepID=A0A379JN22_9NOCA|nr:PhoD-like phosphatase [Nocardia otitidiscaviarum]
MGSNGAVFDALTAENPLFHLALGDLHYGNIESTETGPFFDAYDRLLTQPGQAAFYRSAPIAYVWDDHDYGPNDAGAEAPGRDASRTAFGTTVPHYAFPSPGGTINQAFTLGRVRFILTDTRSAETDTTMLGAEQLAWLIDEIVRSSRTHALVVWGNSMPWIGGAEPGSDSWAGHPDERARIADAIAAAGVRNLLMVAGDAHMVAIDDGTNSDYSTTGGHGFPVLHAAALDRPGNVKGGPYSEGAYPGGGQYGVVDVADDGRTVTVTLTGKRWDGTVLVDYEFTVSAAAP